MSIFANANYLLRLHALIIQTSAEKHSSCYHWVFTTQGGHDRGVNHNHVKPVSDAVIKRKCVYVIISQVTSAPRLFSCTITMLLTMFRLRVLHLNVVENSPHASCACLELSLPLCSPPSVLDDSVKSCWYLVFLIMAFSVFQDVFKVFFLESYSLSESFSNKVLKSVLLRLVPHIQWQSLHKHNKT